jgi:hypothetical protein
MKSFYVKVALCGMAVLLMVREPLAAEISAGGRLGINVSSIFGDTVKSRVPRVGLNLGAYATQWFSERLGLQEELVIGTRGERWKSDPMGLLAYNNYATNFTYLDVPILVKWRLSKNDNVRKALFIGPDLAFPLVAEAEYKGNTADMKMNTQPVDFGMTAGFSVDIRRGDYFIPIDVRYMLSLTNFAKSSDYDAHVMHGVFSISVGVGHLVNFKKTEEK